PRLEVARPVELLAKPARFERARIGGELVAASAGPERLERGLRGEHSRLDRGMRALDPRRIEESRVVAHERTAREDELRERLQPARGDRARAVAQAPSALEEGTDRRMRLVALEFLEGAEIGVRVAEAHHEPDRHLAVRRVVQEGAAVGRAIERPPRGMDHEPRHVLFRRDLPELLQPDAVDLRVDALAQLVALLQALAEVPARALGEER